MGAIPRLSPHTPLHTHATQQTNYGTAISVIACDKREAFVQESAAKQSIFSSATLWIASLRTQ